MGYRVWSWVLEATCFLYQGLGSACLTEKVVFEQKPEVGEGVRVTSGGKHPRQRFKFKCSEARMCCCLIYSKEASKAGVARTKGSNVGGAGHGSGNIQPWGTCGASVGFTWQSDMVCLCLKRIMYCFYHS